MAFSRVLLADSESDVDVILFVDYRKTFGFEIFLGGHLLR
jgi:hypothetical protein